jgi:hypothetical protein
MNKEAKLRFRPGSFDVLIEGDYIICAVSKKKIQLEDLRYWNVELQEAYFSPLEVVQKFPND